MSAGRRRWTSCSRQGLIHAVGISINRWEPWNGVQAVRSGLIDAVQVIYNIFDQNPEDELFPACREMDVAVIARVPFDEGTLTGTLTLDSKWPEGDWRNTYFVAENLKSSVEHAEALTPADPGRDEHARDGHALHPERADRQHDHPRHAQEAARARRILPAATPARCPRRCTRQLRSHRWDRTPTKWSQ